MHSVHLGRQRIAAAFVATVLYMAFLLYYSVVSFPVLPLYGAYFVASIIIGVLFLAVGIVVWLFARDRRVASLCFLCFVFAALTFAGEVESITQDTLHSALTDGVFVTGAIYCMVLLVVRFPCDLLREDARLGTRQRLLRAWLVMLFVLAIGSCLSNFSGVAVGRAAHGGPLLSVLQACDTGYSLGALLTILVVIAFVFGRISSPRQRQQLRLYAAGILMAFLPLFLLTALPLALFGAQHYIPGQFTTLSMVALPLCLGYAVLRYQLLTLDYPVRHCITFIVSATSLLVVACSLLLAVDLLRLKQAALPIDATALVVLVPLVGWWSQKISRWIFSPEDEYYWGVVAGTTGVQPTDLEGGLEGVANSLLATVRVSLQASQVCLLLLDEETGAFRSVPSLDLTGAQKGAQGEDLLRSLTRQLGYPVHGQVTLPDLVQQRLQSANRPLLLREVFQEEQRFNGTLMLYLARPSEPLIVPLRVYETLVGLLFVGERIDQQPYGGPDFERIALLLERFLPEVERFRSVTEDQRHRLRLQTLYRLSALIESRDKTLQELVAAYARALSEAMEAGTEVWWLDERTGASLQRISTYGTTMLSTHTDRLTLREGNVDWHPLFYDRSPQEYGEANTLFSPQPLLLSVPTVPFAWLPLVYDEQRFGVLVLTFARPHRFFTQERQVLCVYAEQCASALASRRLAYRQQRKISELCEEEKQMAAALLVGEQVLQGVLASLQHTLADPLLPAPVTSQPANESEISLRGIAQRPGGNERDLAQLLALLRCHSPHLQSIGKEGVAFVQQAAAFLERLAVIWEDDPHLRLPVDQLPSKVVAVVTQTAQRAHYLSDALFVLGFHPQVCESCEQFLQWASCLARQAVPLALLLDPAALKMDPDVFYRLLAVQFQAERLPRVYVLAKQGGRLASFAEWFSVLPFPLSPTRLRQALLEADEK